MRYGTVDVHGSPPPDWPGLAEAAGGAEGRIFAVPAAIRRLVWLSAGILVALMLACMALPVILPDRFMTIYLGFCGTALFGLLTLATLPAISRLHHRFRADERGLVRIEADGSTTTLEWAEIGRVRERPLLQRLEVSDRSGRRVMRLEYQLDGFEELAERVSRHVVAQPTPALHSPPADARRSERTAVFHRMRTMDFLAALFGPGALVASIILFDGVLFLFAGFALYTALEWLFSWRKIRVEPDAVVIGYPLWARRIGAPDVLGVGLDTTAGQEPNRSVTVVLHVAGRDVIRLSGCREGALALYGALDRAWRAAAAGSPARGGSGE